MQTIIEHKMLFSINDRLTACLRFLCANSQRGINLWIQPPDGHYVVLRNDMHIGQCKKGMNYNYITKKMITQSHVLINSRNKNQFIEEENKQNGA